MATVVEFPAQDLKGKNATGLEQHGSATRCSRCKGLMVVEQCFDSMDDPRHLDFPARRCVQCGEIIDPVILQNRRLQLGDAFGPGRK